MLKNFKKKIPRTALLFFILCVSVIFFAVIIIFTPVSNILSSLLENDLKYTLDKEKYDDSNNFNIDFNQILMKLSFPGINNINDYKLENYYRGLNGADNNNQETGDSLSVLQIEEGKKYNPYENIPLKDDGSILSIYDLYEYYQAASGAKIEDATPNPLSDSEIPPGSYRITPKNYSGQKTKVPKLLINNQTSYTVDLNDYIEKKYPIEPFDPQIKDPVVLILDTHSTESYVEDGTEYYAPPFTAERTTDTNKNVVLVATELRKKLEEYGIPVVQSTKLHDAVSYIASYARSLETMNEYLAKYPSVKYIIDLHRDSIIADTGEKFKPAIKINGRDSAQVMLVIGTDDGGAYHPNWRDNLTFAAYLEKNMNDKYPMLARPINLRDARFNEHVTKGSVILEVGSCGNTFSEALYAADLVGECLAELILEHN